MSDNTSVQTVKSDEFESLLAKNDIIFLDFWAPWCSPCKQFSHVYERVATAFPSIFFGKVNIDEESEFANVFEIRSIPHLIVFKKGIAIYSESGSMPESALKELAEQAMDVDVSDILNELEKK